MQKLRKLIILIAVLLLSATLFSCDGLVKRVAIEVTKEPDAAETETAPAATDENQGTTEKVTAAPIASETASKPTASPTPKPLPDNSLTDKSSTIGQIKYTYKVKKDYFTTFSAKTLGLRVQKTTAGTEQKISKINVSLPTQYTNNWAQYAQMDISYQCDILTPVTVEFGDFKLITDAKNAKVTFVTPKGSENIEADAKLFAQGTNMDIIITFQNYVVIYCNRTRIAKIDCDSYGDATASYTWKLSCEGTGQMNKVNIYNSGKLSEVSEIKAEATGGAKLGLDITNKTDLVGICYTMWFNSIFGNGSNDISNYQYNVTNMLKTYKFSSTKGFYKDSGETSNALTQFHFWGEPAQGYYRSTDKAAHRKNLELLQAANVDFLVLDYTFANTSAWLPGTSTWTTYIEGPMTALLDTIMEMRAEGKKTPYIVLWPNNYVMFDALKTNFIDKSKWADCFVYWSGKPFMMYWNDSSTNRAATSAYNSKLTLRAMYGLQGSVRTGQWSFIEHNNANTVAYDANGKAEHMSCAVAAQRTYMSNTSTAQGRDGGNFWYKQWKNVFNVHPKIVTVCWWNEWAAQLYKIDGAGYVFTDNFNQEYSRDIEPMKGGHGDQYYQWLIKYVKAYKNHESCPKLTSY